MPPTAVSLLPSPLMSAMTGDEYRNWAPASVLFHRSVIAPPAGDARPTTTVNGAARRARAARTDRRRITMNRIPAEPAANALQDVYGRHHACGGERVDHAGARVAEEEAAARVLQPAGRAGENAGPSPIDLVDVAQVDDDDAVAPIDDRAQAGREGVAPGAQP